MSGYSSCKWALVAAVALLGMTALPQASSASTCSPSSTVQCFTFTDNSGNGGVTVPFGSVSVTTAGSVLTFNVDLNPNFSITAGNAHDAFAFAIGTATGTANGTGTIGAITQAGGAGTLSAEFVGR